MPRTSEMPSRRPGGRPPVKTRRLAAAVGAATLGGCVVAVATGAAPVEPSIRGLLRAHGVAVEAINLSADGIVARHLSTQADSWRVDVADVKTPVPGTSGATTADDIVVTTPQEVYRVKHIELAGSALSSADLAALFDPKNATPIGERLSRLTADQVRIPEVSADETAGEIKTRRTYRDVVLTNVASGRIATASVGRRQPDADRRRRHDGDADDLRRDPRPWRRCSAHRPDRERGTHGSRRAEGQALRRPHRRRDAAVLAKNGRSRARPAGCRSSVRACAALRRPCPCPISAHRMRRRGNASSASPRSP